MGSQSDYPVVKKSEKVLKNLDIGFESRICSAHRQSDLMIKTAKFEDNITVITNILKSSAVRLTLKQDIKIKDTLLFTSEVELAVVKENGSVQKLPKELLSKIN